MDKSNLNQFESLIARIREEYPNLSKRLQQVARYLLENPNEIAIGTIALISENAEVTPSTLIRFANAFDYKGFSEMQKLFQHNLLRSSMDYDKRIEKVQGDDSLESDNVSYQLLEQFSYENSKAMNFMCQTANRNDLADARNLLTKASTIHVKAVRRSFPVATYLSYVLNHINFRCFLLDGIGGMAKEQEHLILPEDALVVISYHPYADESLQTAKAAFEKKVPILLITDSPLSPIATYASVCLCVKEAEVHSFRSLTATMCLVQALAISLIR